MKCFVVTTLLAVFCAKVAGQEPQAWNQFRGPDGRGQTSEEASLPAQLSLTETLLWKVGLPAGHSSPCFWGDRIFLTSYEDSKLSTTCLDRKNGRLLWQRVLACPRVERTQRINSPASPSPCTDGTRVYAYFGSFGLISYNLDGEEIWRREMPTPENIYGTAASPILAGGKLIFINDARTGSYLEAIDPENGKTLWHADRKDQRSGWSTPTLWQRDAVDELLVYGKSWLHAYDLSDGSIRWAVPGLADEPIVMPAVGEGLVFVTSYNMGKNEEVVGLPEFSALLEEFDQDESGDLNLAEANSNVSVLSRFEGQGEGDHPLGMFFRFLDNDEDGAISAKEYEKLGRWLDNFKQINGVVAIRPDNGKGAPEIAWQYPRGVPECPSPLFHAGRLYLIKNGGVITCLDAKSGELLFSGRTGLHGPHYASPVLGDGKIYCASSEGRVAVVTASDKLEVLSNNDLGERIMATPALVNGVVYVRGAEHLFAFRDK